MCSDFHPQHSYCGILSNMGVFLSFILPFVSLIILQRQRGKLSQIPLTVVALIIVIGLVLYCIFSLGTTMSERLPL